METSTETREWVQVGTSDAIPEGEARTFDVAGVGVAIARVEGRLYAVQDLCTHDDGPLGEGSLSGFAIQCPRHGAQFDIRTGAVLSMPAIAPIGTYEVTEKDGLVLVGLKGPAADDNDDDW